MLSGYTLAAGYLALSLARAQTPALADAPVTTFGITVYDALGLRGDIYLLTAGTLFLPKFEKLKPLGSVYASALNVAPRSFTEGFPGVTDRFEWFAIDYNGHFYIGAPGPYRFLLASDDGSILYIDNKKVIDNDGIHPIQKEECKINLTGGLHRIRVSYFQGPREHVALILAVARPGEDWRVFSTREFLPPGNPADWKFGDPSQPPRNEPTAPRKK